MLNSIMILKVKLIKKKLVSFSLRNISCTLLCLLLSSCGKPVDTRDERAKATDHVVNQCLNTIGKRYKLGLTAFGGGSIDSVKYFDFGFETNKPKTIEEFREMMVFCLDTYYNEVNSYEPLQEFLFQRPFPYDHFDFSIKIPLKYKNKVSLNEPTFVFNDKNIIKYYNTNDEKDEFAPWTLLLEETIDEAKKKLKEGKSNS